MENQAQVRLVFAGELVAGHSPDEVQRLFGELFKLEGERLAAVFSGQRTVLKRSIAQGEGERYIARLRKMGMRVVMEPLDAWPDLTPLGTPDAPAAPVPAPPPVVSSAPAKAAAPAAAPAAAIPPLVPLEEEVTCPNCGERQPKRFLLCRSCTTDIAYALAAKQDDADRARAERLAARQGERFAPPKAELGGNAYATGDTVDPPPMLSLSFQGRMGRVSYFNSGFVAMAGIAALGVLMAVLLPTTRSLLMLIPIALGGLGLLVWNLRFTALRLHDVNLSGWWGLLYFIPYLGGLLSLLLMLWPGNADDNDYGPKPRRGSWVILVVVGVLTLLLIGIGFSAYTSYVRKAKGMQESSSEGSSPVPSPSHLRSQAARDAYQAYAQEPKHKAFAASGDGAWGWVSGKANPREAMREAFGRCDLNRKPYTAQCTVVNVNGMWTKEEDDD